MSDVRYSTDDNPLSFVHQEAGVYYSHSANEICGKPMNFVSYHIPTKILATRTIYLDTFANKHDDKLNALIAHWNKKLPHTWRYSLLAESP